MKRAQWGCVECLMRCTPGWLDRSIEWCGIWQICWPCDWVVYRPWVVRCHGLAWSLLWFYILRPFRASIAARLLWDYGLRWDWWDCDYCTLCVSERLMVGFVVLLCFIIGLFSGFDVAQTGNIFGGVGWVNMIGLIRSCNRLLLVEWNWVLGEILSGVPSLCGLRCILTCEIPCIMLYG